MKTNQILTALNLVANKNTTSHASKIAELFTFWSKHKQFIVSIEKELCNINFGLHSELQRRVYNSPAKRVITYDGYQLQGTKYIISTQIGSAKGTYSCSMPNQLIEAFEVVLNGGVKIINNEYDNELAKVKKVVEINSREYSKVIKVEKVADKFCFVYTNGWFIYKSKPFVIQDKTDTYFLDAKTVNIIDYSGFPNYEPLLKPTNKGIMFDRKEFLQNIKINLPYCNKYTNKIDLHLNGKVCFNSKDIDFSKDINTNMPYCEKQGFEVFDISINGKYMQKLLSVLDTDVVSFCVDTPKTQIYIKGEEVECLLMPVLNK